MDYLIVAGFGALVGIGELVSRYRDAPGRALIAGSAALYVAINALAAAGALGLIQNTTPQEKEVIADQGEGPARAG